MTSTEYIKKMLLEGRHITKTDVYKAIGTLATTQRIHEIRREGWNVQEKAIKGKNGLAEYWLEPEEIARITKPVQKPLGLFGEL